MDTKRMREQAKNVQPVPHVSPPSARVSGSMRSFSNGAEDREGLDDQSSDRNMGSSTAFAYIALRLVRVPSIPDTSNIEIEKPSDSNILIAASSPEGVCIWRQPQSLTRFRMNQYIWKIQRLKSQNLLVFPIWLKKIWTNIPMTSVVYAESDKILTPDMVYTKLVSDDILRCEKITDAQVKLYRLNKSCVDHASPQLKTWINKLIFPICTFVKLAEKMLVDKSFL